jgi:hypothetical protein
LQFAPCGAARGHSHRRWDAERGAGAGRGIRIAPPWRLGARLQFTSSMARGDTYIGGGTKAGGQAHWRSDWVGVHIGGGVAGGCAFCIDIAFAAAGRESSGGWRSRSHGGSVARRCWALVFALRGCSHRRGDFARAVQRGRLRVYREVSRGGVGTVRKILYLQVFVVAGGAYFLADLGGASSGWSRGSVREVCKVVLNETGGSCVRTVKLHTSFPLVGGR